MPSGESRFNVSGTGSRWDGTLFFISHSVMTISDGATVHSPLVYMIGEPNGAPYQPVNASAVPKAIVTGTGSLWDITDIDDLGILDIRDGGATIVRDGGLVVADQIHLGAPTAPSYPDYAGPSWESFLTASGGGVIRAGVEGQGTIILGNEARSQSTLNVGENNGVAGSIEAAEIKTGEGVGTVIFNHSSSNAVFAPNLSGTLTVSHVGTGMTSLTGTSSFSGTLSVTAGTLQIGNGGTNGFVAGNIVNDAALRFNRADSIVYGGTISGGGSVSQVGPSTLSLTGDNTFTGGLWIHQSGTVDIGGGTAGGSIASNITNAGSVVFNRTTNWTYPGIISGTGSLYKAGSGTLFLSGDNTFTGDLHLQAGTIAFAQLSNLGNGGDLRFDGGSLLWQSGNTTDITLQRRIVLGNGGGTINTNGNNITFAAGFGSGDSGGLTKAGSGTLTLNGSNSYLGGTTISGGALQIGAGGTFGQITGNVINNAILVFNRSDAVNFPSDISGSGVLVHEGKGALTLGGSNSYAGGTVIRSGALNINNATALGTGSLTFASPLLLDNTSGADIIMTGSFGQNWNANITFQGSNSLHMGTGSILMNAARTVTVHQNSLTIGGAISASKATFGLTKTGNGMLVLGGDNTYAGATTISQGVLRLGDGGSAGSVAGKIVNNASLEIFRDDHFTYGSIISGRGGLRQLGSGTTTLSGANTYSGATVVENGRLRLGNAKALGKSSRFQVDGPGTLDLNGFRLTATSLEGDGTILNDGAAPVALTVKNTAESVYAGSFLDAGAPFEFIKQGRGALTLSGSSSFSGGTTLASGTLNLGHAAALGTGMLTISGASAIDNTSGATLALANAQNWKGNFIFKGSNDLRITGPVTLAATRTVTVAAGTLAVDGVISGARPTHGLTKKGPGTMVLTANNTYAGTTTISSGTLQIGDGGTTGSVSGKIVNNGVLVSDRSDEYTLSNAISGKGILIQNGEGTILVEGNNSHTGGTILNRGTFDVGSDKALGRGDLTLNDGILTASDSQQQIKVGRDLRWDGDAHIALTLDLLVPVPFVTVARNLELLGNAPLTFDFNLPDGVFTESFLIMTVAKGFGSITAADFAFTAGEDISGSFRIDGQNLFFDMAPASFEDSFITIANFTGFQGPSINAVPEPSAGALILLAAATFRLRNRSRRKAGM